MTTANDARRAHDVLDGLFAGHILSRENEQLLRSFLPELPKQKTLAEIIAHVDDAWSVASDNDWGGNSYDPDVSIEDWLTELHAQLQGLKDTPADPVLPAGMRIADHVNFGRVVVSPGVGVDKCHEIFYLDPGMASGTDISEVEPDSLTFLSPKPAHPEFLETEEDYRKAPEGTVVARDNASPWVKKESIIWDHSGGANGNYSMSLAGRRTVLRWGWGE